MKKFLIAGTSLAAVATAGSAGAVDITLGGLKLYAGYDAADEGGKVGATLSF